MIVDSYAREWGRGDLRTWGLGTSGPYPLKRDRPTWNAKAAKPAKHQIQPTLFATFARFAFDVVLKWYRFVGDKPLGDLGLGQSSVPSP